MKCDSMYNDKVAHEVFQKTIKFFALSNQKRLLKFLYCSYVQKCMFHNNKMACGNSLYCNSSAAV